MQIRPKDPDILSACPARPAARWLDPWRGLVLGGVLPVLAAVSGDVRAERWIAAWSTAAQSADTGTGFVADAVREETLRQFVRIPLAGRAVRVRFSNAEGTLPLRIMSATIAVRQAHSAVRPDTIRALTFGGSREIEVAAGDAILSDAAVLEVQAGMELAVSIYVSGDAGLPSMHLNALQASYAHGRADLTDAPRLPAEAKELASWYWLGTVDVLTSEVPNLVVIIGDSTADGIGSTPTRNWRLVDRLNDRLVARPPHMARFVALSAGIAGNRLLNDVIGPSVSARFGRDVLQLGAGYAVLSTGINDIAFSEGADDPADIVSAEQLIVGLETIARRAETAGVRVIAATLTPFKGSRLHSERGEAIRTAVNAWIRTSRAFYGVVDFDQLLRDAEEPARLRAEYDSGDHVHPNDSGYHALAEAIEAVLPQN